MQPLRNMLRPMTFGRGLLLILGAKALAQVWLYIDGYYGVSADDCGRTINALHWAQNPHLVIQGVWLPLDQYLFGTALLLWRNLVWAPRLVVLLLGHLSLVLLALSARELLRADCPALLAAAIAGSLPWHLWTTGSALSEQLLLVPALGMLLFLLRFSRTQAASDLLAASFCCALATMVRYEAWFYTMLFPVVVVYFVLSGVRMRTGFVISALLPFIHPFLWVVGNRMVHGQWFTFFHHSAQAFNWAPHTPVPQRLILELPAWLFGHSPVAVAGALIGLVLYIHRHRTSRVWLYLALPITHLLAVIASEAVGASASHTPQRLLFLVAVVLQPFGAWLIVALARRDSAGGFLTIPLVLLVALIIGQGLIASRTPPIVPFDRDNMLVGRALAQHFAKFPHANAMVEMRDWGFLGIQVYSGHPDRVLLDMDPPPPSTGRVSRFDQPLEQLRAECRTRAIRYLAAIDERHCRSIAIAGATLAGRYGRWQLFVLEGP